MPLDAPRPRRTLRRASAVLFVVCLGLLSARSTASELQSGLGATLADQAATRPALVAARVAAAPAAVRGWHRMVNDPLQVGAGAPRGPRLEVPILVYHYILDVQPTPDNVMLFNLAVSPRLFAAQMALLHDEGANPITPAMLVDALAGKRGLPPHPVVLTFDDGYTDFATNAAPALLKYGFVATDYVVSGFIGRPGYMTATQVRRMDAEGLVIGSHTVHHVDLSTVAPAVASMEIDGGKAALEQLLGHPVLDFAYPYGGFDAPVEQMVRAAGFRDAVTTVGGDTQTLVGDFELHRTHIGGAQSLATFAALASLAPLGAAPATTISAQPPGATSGDGALTAQWVRQRDEPGRPATRTA